MGYVTSQSQYGSRETLIEAIIRNIASENSRILLGILLSNIVNENDVETAIKKLCGMNEIYLLRIYMILSLGVDPLIGRDVPVETCSFTKSGDILELYFNTSSGDALCFGIYMLGSLKTPVSCRSGKSIVQDKQEIFVKVE